MTTGVFIENILNKYVSPAYHIKFYCNAETGITNGPTSNGTTFSSQIGLAGQQVTLAESGITGYNIASLTLNTLTSPGSPNRNTVALDFAMVINEPQGTSFLDAMYIAVESLGVQNWQKTDYYVDISFKGYNEDGSFNSNLCSSFSNGGTWTYKLRVVNVVVDLNAAGSTYTLTGYAADEDGLSEDIGKIPSSLNVVAQTMGDFLQGLANGLNQLNQTQYQVITSQNLTSEAAQLTTYAFEFAPLASGDDPNQWQLLYGDDVLQSFRNRGFTIDLRSNQTINIAAGTSIADAVVWMLGATYEGQLYMLNADGTDNGDLGDGSYRAAGTFNVLPQVQHTAFDTATNNYVTTVTYYIKLFRAQNTMLQTAEVNTTSNGNLAIEDVQAYGGLRKNYDWLHTGLNSEVLEFNPRINFNFNPKLPFLAGFYHGQEGVEHHAQFNTDYALIPATLQNLNSGTSTATPTQRQAQTNTAIGGGRVQTSNANTSTVYAEDVVNGTSSSNPFVVSLTQGSSFVKEGAGMGISGYWNRRRSIYGALLNQLHRPAQTLNEVDMTIRGDPYWLGVDYGSILNTATQSGNQDLPDFTSGSQCFAVVFKYPFGDQPDSDLGLPVMKDDNVFTGLYSAMGITHSFEGGTFKQTFRSAKRVTTVTPQQVIQAIAQAQVTGTNNATSSAGSSASGNASNAASSVSAPTS